MLSKKPLVSVIVPIYGVERYLGICIESIINQTYRNLEIILVDDGSKDRCPEICDLYAKKDSRIRVIHKPNGGLVSARKAGLFISTGEYIGYVDGDDWIGSGFFESMITETLLSGADITIAGFTRDLFDKSVNFINSSRQGLYEGDELKHLWSEMLSVGNFHQLGVTTYVWNKLFKRQVLYNHQMNVDDRITIGEDAAVVYPAMLSCKKVCIIDNCAYHYRQREDSMLKKISSFAADAEKVKILYEYLLEVSSNSQVQNIATQIVDFVLGICIMRSGGIVTNGKTSNDSFVPYPIDFRNKKVVVYSAGTFGQQLVNRVKETKYCKIVGWIDDDYWEYRRCCMDVDPICSITKWDYDYILVATINSATAETIKHRMLDYGVPPQKILLVRCPTDNRIALIANYLC